MKNYLIFAHAIRAISSVGSEHLVYTQRVGGSNPSSPTKHSDLKRDAFFLHQSFIYMPYCVYILHSPTMDKFYIGYTANLQERIIRHNQRSKGFIGKVSDWIIVYKEHFEIQCKALLREKQIKSWKSKVKIKALIGI